MGKCYQGYTQCLFLCIAHDLDDKLYFIESFLAGYLFFIVSEKDAINLFTIAKSVDKNVFVTEVIVDLNNLLLEMMSMAMLTETDTETYGMESHNLTGDVKRYVSVTVTVMFMFVIITRSIS